MTIAAFLLTVCAAALPLRAQCADGEVFPCGGERVQAGGLVQIRWAAQPVADQRVDLWLWDGESGVYREIVRSFPGAAGKYSWSVPEGLRGKFFRIRLQAGQRSWMSPSYFWIVGTAEVPPAPPPLPSPSSVSIRPNPSTGEVLLEWGLREARLVSLWNILGQRVKTLGPGQLFSPLLLQMPELASGLYRVEVEFTTAEKATGWLLLLR